MDPSPPKPETPVKPLNDWLEMDEGSSIFDEVCANQPAQYAKEGGSPKTYWSEVSTILSNLDTRKLHYVKVPENHVVIDFDIVDETGEKSLEKNIEAAAKWPATYAEVSKSGKGIHLHYTYIGDVTALAQNYSEGIEVKTLLGDSSLRRQLSRSNHLNITPLDGGLPRKEKPLITNKSIQTEKGLRELIERNLRKEIHSGTKSSVDFIHKILEEAYDSGLSYDVRDLRGKIITFAAKSTNQADKALKVVQTMQFVGQSEMPTPEDDETPIVFFDIEVYPNLFVVCWKVEGSEETSRLINPSPADIEPLLSKKLVGFNNRRYDNHILYAAYMGYSNEELYNLSNKIVTEKYNKNFFFGEAYNLSYADIYDFSSKKQGLKKFQIELGLFHMELDIPWDQPVPKEQWDRVIQYCVNDVVSTEKVFESRHLDFVARQILAELSGLSVNHTTQAHTAKIIFGEEREPQRSFVYTDLSEMFPGYVYGPVKNPVTGKDVWESTYNGEVTGEGGYVYAEPGVYKNVAVLDVASMHPTSIEQLNLFGPYTERYSELKEARVAIKRKEYDRARTMLDGKLTKFLDGNEESAEGLSFALKIVINIVYGLTSAKFPNKFRDNRNKDNIVAKRGALFMIDLKKYLQENGFQVIHIKTDSVKIPDADEHPEVIDMVMEFGKKYGYDFEHEVTYDRMCLVNEAVYIAQDGDMWSAVGAQFQHPYVFKTLFSREDITFDDYCETKNVVQGAMYLDFTESGDVSKMQHVGRTGSFVPVVYGGDLWRVKDDKNHAVTGTKGYKWITRDMAIERDKKAELLINYEYFKDLTKKAKEAIEKYDATWFDEQ